MKNYKSLQNGSDIRGVALKLEGGKDVNLTANAAADLAQAFCVWLSRKNNCSIGELTVALGRDCRLTGEALQNECMKRLSENGVKVLDCSMASTPAMFMATKFYDADGSIMFTASHLPKERNGLKFFDKNGGLEHEDISEIIAIAENLEASAEEKGVPVQSINLMDQYCAHLRKIICEKLDSDEQSKPLSGLHVVVDAGNGCGGFFAEKVLKTLGADIGGSQFLDAGGSFPNHIPNPEDKTAMESVCDAVIKSGADIGIIFDTDVDRASAVASDGKEIGRNRIVALAACLACETNPGTTIVTDSITSTHLNKFIEGVLGCHHYRFKRGYKNVIDKGIELNKNGIDCALAIETSGHAAMKENFFLDDGAYLATKIVIKAAELKKEGKHIEDLLRNLSDPLEATEIRFNVNTPEFSEYAQSIIDYLRSEAESIDGWRLELPNYEGVRVNTEDGWFLLRKSLHDPVVPLNIESDVPGGCEKTLRKIKEVLKDFDKLQ